MNNDRIVVTGVGAVCGLGVNLQVIWDAIGRGESPRRPVSAYFDVEAALRAYSLRDGSIIEVCGLPLDNQAIAQLAEVERWKDYDRHQLFALLAAKQAMASFPTPDRFHSRSLIGCIGGTGDGGLQEDDEAHTLLAAGKRLGPRSNIRELPNLFTGMVANRFELRGPNATHCGACAASAQAIVQAAMHLRMGDAQAMLVVGAEAAITKFGIASFNGQRAISSDSRPFRKDREGFLMGEGAGALLLEREPFALCRGAKPLAILAGWGTSADGNATGAITAPDPSGGARSAVAAMTRAGVTPDQIDYVKAHGTGTPEGDAAEIAGIRIWQPDDELAIGSPKSFIGHLLGAAGAIESALTVKMLQEERVITNRGLTLGNRDEAFDDLLVLWGESPLQGFAGLKHVLLNSFGFGGTNASLVMSRYK